MTLKEFIRTKNARIIVWVVIIVAIALFLWFTAPKTASKTEPGNVNVNNSLQPAANLNANLPAGEAGAPKAAVKKPAAPKVVGFTEK
jgi:hypothetical protein